MGQSGETVDTLAAMEEVKRQGIPQLTVCNVVGSQATRIADGVIYTRAGLEVGVAASKTFTAGCTTTSNAARVSTRRNGVIMLFAKIFGISTTNLSATATAVMDFASAVGKGCLPIVLDKNYTNPGTQIIIKMTTDITDNAGWFVLPPDSASAATLKDYVNRDNCPPLKIGDIINLQNGADASVLAAIKDELNTYHPNGWDTFLPVVDTPKPNQQQPVVAFVPFRITNVVSTTSAKRVEGYVLNILDMPSALPGGPNYGALAPPKAVR